LSGTILREGYTAGCLHPLTLQSIREHRRWIWIRQQYQHGEQTT